MASVRALIVDQGRILLLQRCAAGSRPEQWCLPGGRLHQDEDPHSALLRETFEETGLEIRIESHLHRHQECDYFLCSLPRAQSIRLNTAESQAWIWVEPEQIETVGQIMDYRQLRLMLSEMC